MENPITFRFFLLIFLSFYFQSTYAQFAIGPSAGIGITSKKDLRGASLGYGLAVEYALSDNIIFHTGLVRIERFVGGLLYLDYEGDVWTLNGFIVPMTVKLKIKGENAGAYFNIGGFIGMPTKPRYLKDNTFSSPNPDFRKFETGGILGFGMDIPMEHLDIYLEIQDRFNVTDLTANGDEHELFVNTFDFLRIGILFPIRFKKE